MRRMAVAYSGMEPAPATPITAASIACGLMRAMQQASWIAACKFARAVDSPRRTMLVPPAVAEPTTVAALLAYVGSDTVPCLPENDAAGLVSTVLSYVHGWPNNPEIVELARTFQRTSVFQTVSVFENVMIGLHRRGKSRLFDTLLSLPRERSSEAELRASEERFMPGRIAAGARCPLAIQPPSWCLRGRLCFYVIEICQVGLPARSMRKPGSASSRQPNKAQVRRYMQ